MLIAVSCIILFLSFTVVPFAFSVKVEIDALNNAGQLVLSVFSIPIYKAKINVEHKNSLIYNLILKHGKKMDEIHLNADKEDKQSIIAYLKAVPIMSYVKFSRLSLDGVFGFQNDAFSTTMITGIARTVFYSVAAFLKSRNDMIIDEKLTPEYNADRVQVNIFGIFSLSIADIINSYAAGFFKKVFRRT